MALKMPKQNKTRKPSLVIREKVRELFLQYTPQRKIATQLGIGLNAVNNHIKVIREEYLSEIKKRDTLGELYAHLKQDKETVIKAAWAVYQVSMKDGKNPGAASNSLGTIDRANANFVASICRLGIIEEAPLKLEHAGAFRVVVGELPPPSSKERKK